MEPAPRRRSLRVRSRQALRPPEGRIAGGWWRQRPGRTDVTRRRGKRDSEAAQEHPEATRQPPGWAQWGPPARLSPARDPHIATGARPAHPLTHAVGGEAGPPGGGAGSPACGCCNAPPDPTAAGQDAGSALTPLPHAPATISAPRPPLLDHSRSGRYSHGRAGPKDTITDTELRTNSPPSPGTPHL